MRNENSEKNRYYLSISIFLGKTQYLFKKISSKNLYWSFLILGLLTANFSLTNRHLPVGFNVSEATAVLGGPVNANLSEIYEDSLTAANRAAENPAEIPPANLSYGDKPDFLNQNNFIAGSEREKIDAEKYFAPPASGWNWGILHANNAVDVANDCGTPVYASAEGITIRDKNLGDGSTGFNGGYGIFVLIEHPNGSKTRYAHLKNAVVPNGRIVKKGEIIGYMGNTGNTHGPTGCHLHFEVLGTKNPLVN